MICYKDRSFCIHSRECGNYECDRKFTANDFELATKWWGDTNFPVMLAQFKQEGCGYKERE